MPEDVARVRAAISDPYAQRPSYLQDGGHYEPLGSLSFKLDSQEASSSQNTWTANNAAAGRHTPYFGIWGRVTEPEYGRILLDFGHFGHYGM